ncbi:hypothetical protein BY458DRAFT_300607 [Sporodiniella umbellata]|nr:hypothetical protein BY458DRAFT_300607 [Sporodiniella umbellata]
MKLLDLPAEIQFIIVRYIKEGNCLNLASLAQTCLFYKKLLSYKLNWGNTVKLFRPRDSNQPKESLQCLIHSVNLQRTIDYQSIESEVLDDLALLRLTNNILRKSTDSLKRIRICVSSELHAQLYSTLSRLDIQLTHLSIHDPTCDFSHVISSAKAYQLPLLKSQSTLQTLDIPTFPSHELCRMYRFPNLKTLTIALGHDIRWNQFKSMFPHLEEITLVLGHINQLNTIRSLLSDISLFPWFKRISVVSREPLKEYLSKEELKVSVSRLEGLYRVTAGWDIIALY